MGFHGERNRLGTATYSNNITRYPLFYYYYFWYFFFNGPKNYCRPQKYFNTVIIVRFQFVYIYVETSANGQSIFDGTAVVKQVNIRLKAYKTVTKINRRNIVESTLIRITMQRCVLQYYILVQFIRSCLTINYHVLHSAKKKLNNMLVRLWVSRRIY